MGERWKPSHEKKATVYDLAKDAVKEVSECAPSRSGTENIPAEEENYQGFERRKRKRWRLVFSLERDSHTTEGK